MEFSVKIGVNPERQQSDCIIAGIFESYYFTSVAEYLDKISNGYISSLSHHGAIKGKLGQTLLLYRVPNIMSERILLVGCGKENELDEEKYKQIVQKIVHTLNDTGSVEVLFFLNELHVKGLDTYWKIRQAVEKIEETTYHFNQLMTNKRKPDYPLHKIIFNVLDQHEFIDSELAVKQGLAISKGIKVAKDLSNMPPNICNSAYLASQAHQLADTFSRNITVHVINEQQMRQLEMQAYLAVGNGSRNESLMSVIEYKNNPEKNSRPIVLVGKGLTFDSGGISIKPSQNMDEMKYDMCGAAAVYGVIQTAAELRIPLNIIGILAGCENMPDGYSYRPGDVLTTMSGQTVEVLNTDAEGRLVLCDVLTYVERFNPEVVIDVATLTGSCVVALGHHITGLISNHDSLANELISASEQSGDHVWRLPLNDKFQKQLESDFADMTNSGGRAGGTITAGCFLSRFTNNYNWAHLDIAGTAWNSGKNKGATGRPVALLSQFLFNRTNFDRDHSL